MTPVQAPSGRWYIAGFKVPLQLGFVGYPNMTDEYIADQLRLPPQFRAIRPRTWETEEAARDAIKHWGETH